MSTAAICHAEGAALQTQKRRAKIARRSHEAVGRSRCLPASVSRPQKGYAWRCAFRPQHASHYLPQNVPCGAPIPQSGNRAGDGVASTNPQFVLFTLCGLSGNELQTNVQPARIALGNVDQSNPPIVTQFSTNHFRALDGGAQVFEDKRQISNRAALANVSDDFQMHPHCPAVRRQVNSPSGFRRQESNDLNV